VARCRHPLAPMRANSANSKPNTTPCVAVSSDPPHPARIEKIEKTPTEIICWHLLPILGFPFGFRVSCSDFTSHFPLFSDSGKLLSCRALTRSLRKSIGRCCSSLRYHRQSRGELDSCHLTGVRTNCRQITPRRDICQVADQRHGFRARMYNS